MKPNPMSATKHTTGSTDVHTKGPWEYQEDGGIVWLPVKDANGHRCMVLQTSGELVGHFKMSDYYWNGHHEEVRANARLIASAPAMLAELTTLRRVNAALVEACKEVIWRADHNNVPVPTWFTPAVDSVRAALSQTKGEA